MHVAFIRMLKLQTATYILRRAFFLDDIIFLKLFVGWVIWSIFPHKEK